MADHALDPTIAVDEFAQTRGADDLFDDEIIPITGDQAIQHVEEPTTEQEQPTETTAQQAAPTTRRNRGHGRGGAHTDGGRGRGRGRGRGGRGASDAGPKKEPASKEVAPAVEPKGKEPDEPLIDEAGDEKKEEEAEEDGNENKTTARAENARVHAVRGDRSGTGGIRKPKLTEEELVERMAAAKLNAAKKAEAHARAEADEASFHERERVAAEKRRQELVNRKAMDNERERNRMRKLGAQTGREWDAEKKEEDYNGRRGGGSQYRRGMHGAVSGLPRREQEDTPDYFDDNPGFRGRGRGRGGRGRGRGSGGAGRGGKGESSRANDRPVPQVTPGINSESEFPALSTPKEVAASADSGSTGEKPQSTGLEKVAFPVDSLSPAEGTWAEQVESNEA